MIERPHWNNQKDYTGKLRLDKNENLMIPNNVIQSFISKIESDDIRYYVDLKGAYESLTNYLSINPSCLLLTSGADDALKQLIYFLSRKHNSLLYFHPTFAMVDVYCKMFGISPWCEIHTYNNESNCFEKNFQDEVITHLLKDNYKNVYIANPDNPTGGWIEYETIEMLLKTYPHINFILDEAYTDFFSKKRDNVYYEDLINENKNLFIVRTFSKSHGMAGVKIGYILSQPENIIELNSYKLGYEINGIASKFLKSLPLFDEYIKKTIHKRIYLEDFFRGRGFNVIKTETNFILIENNLLLENRLKKFSVFKTVNINNKQYIKLTVSDGIEIDYERIEYEENNKPY